MTTSVLMLDKHFPFVVITFTLVQYDFQIFKLNKLKIRLPDEAQYLISVDVTLMNFDIINRTKKFDPTSSLDLICRFHIFLRLNFFC